jgi:hypothetical protein
LQDFQYLPAILGLGHYLEVFFQSEQLAEAVPKNRMVVGYHDPDLRTRRGLRSELGTVGYDILRHTISALGPL